MATPKIGDPIPGTKLVYDEADIANLGTDTIKQAAPVNTTNLPGDAYLVGTVNGIKQYQDKSGNLYNYTQPSQGIYSDSTSIKGTETAIGTDLQKMVAGVQKTGQDYDTFLKDYRTSLEKRRQEEIESIKRDAEAAQASLLQKQKGEIGTTSAGLARAGGYLGFSGSSSGVMQNLADAHKTEISTLEAKKNEAIRQAQNAYEEDDFKTAQAILDNAKEIEKTIEDRKNTFFNQTLQASQELRAKTTAEQGAENIKLDNARQDLQLMISSGAIGDLGETDLTQLSTDTGMSVESIKAIKEAANRPDTKVQGSASDGFYRISLKKDGSVSIEQLTAGTGQNDEEIEIANAFLKDVTDKKQFDAEETSDTDLETQKLNFITRLSVKYGDNVDIDKIKEYVDALYPSEEEGPGFISTLFGAIKSSAD